MVHADMGLPFRCPLLDGAGGHIFVPTYNSKELNMAVFAELLRCWSGLSFCGDHEDRG